MNSALTALHLLLWAPLYKCQWVSSPLRSLPRLPKCCPPGEAMASDLGGCTKITSRQLQPLYLGGIFDTLTEYEWIDSGFPKCVGSSPALRFERNREETSKKFWLEDPTDLDKGLADEYADVFKQFCVDSVVDRSNMDHFSGTAAALCEPSRSDVCQEKPCFQLCCPQWHQGDDCRDSGLIVPAPTMYERSLGLREPRVSKISADIRYYHNDLRECQMDVVTLPESDSTKLYEDGTLLVGEVLVESVDYCIQHIFNEEGGGEVSHWERNFRICGFNQTRIQGGGWMGDEETRRYITSVCLCVSLLFYLLTLAVVWIRKRKTLFGVMLLCLIFTRLAFCTAYTYIQYSANDFLANNRDLCISLGFTLHFSYLSGSCWLAALAFNVYNTFSGVRNKSLNREGLRKDGLRHPHFKRYVLFAMGVPVGMLCITLVANFMPISVTGNSAFMPRIGQQRCFFKKDNVLAQLLYFHIVNLACNISTLILYLITLYKLVGGIWATSPILADRLKRSRIRTKNILIFKLFFVLGITWVVECLSLVPSLDSKGLLVRTVLFLGDCINSLQGLFLFVVMVTDSSVFNTWMKLIQRTKSSLKREVDGNAGLRVNFRMRDENSISEMVKCEATDEAPTGVVRRCLSAFFAKRKYSYELERLPQPRIDIVVTAEDGVIVHKL